MAITRLRLTEQEFWSSSPRILMVMINEYQAIEYEQSRRLAYWTAGATAGNEIPPYKKKEEPPKTVHSFYFF